MADDGIASMSEGKPCLVGRRVRLLPFNESHITERYLSWLVDDEVNRYSRRYGQPAQTANDVRAWMASLPADEIIFAVETQGYGHIGNIKYGPIHWSNLEAEISIMMGATDAWGQGFGAEATYLLSQYLFLERNLNRLFAGSINPAFIKMVENLGWKREGILRQQVRIAGTFCDSTLLSLLASEFQRNEKYEPDHV